MKRKQEGGKKPPRKEMGYRYFLILIELPSPIAHKNFTIVVLAVVDGTVLAAAAFVVFTVDPAVVEGSLNSHLKSISMVSS